MGAELWWGVAFDALEGLVEIAGGTKPYLCRDLSDGHGSGEQKLAAFFHPVTQEKPKWGFPHVALEEMAAAAFADAYGVGDLIQRNRLVVVGFDVRQHLMQPLGFAAVKIKGKGIPAAEE